MLEEIQNRIIAMGYPLTALRVVPEADATQRYATYHHWGEHNVMAVWTRQPDLSCLNIANQMLRAPKIPGHPAYQLLSNMDNNQFRQVCVEVVMAVLKKEPALAERLGIPVNN